MLRFKLFPAQIHIVICQVKGIHNIILIRTVEYRRRNVESQCLRCKGQMDLQYLPDIHTGRHTQRVQYDIQRTPVRQERHILHRQHTGNNTLVSVTSCHLIPYRNLPLLCNINADSLVHTRRQLIAVVPGKYLRIHDDTILTMGYFQRSIPYLPGFLSENRPKQTLFRRKLRLSLRRHLAHKNISCAHLRTNPDDSSLIQILQGVVSHTRDIPRDLFRSKLGITGFRLILFDMDRCIYILLHQTLAQQHGILVIVAFPRHEPNQRVLAKGHLAVRRRRSICNHVACLHLVSFEHNRPLVIAVALVTSQKLCKLISFQIAVRLTDGNLRRGRTLYHAAFFRDHTDAGIHRRLLLHTGSDYRSLCHQKRHCLTLHVGTHQRTVRIVVL